MSTPDRLSLDRFRALAEAYGSTIARWPASMQGAARDMASDPSARAILARAAVLDDDLDLWRIPRPDSRLIDRIARSASPLRQAAAWRRARLWWSAVGLAAALAGAGAGALAASAVAAAADASSDGGTVFGDSDGQEG